MNGILLHLLRHGAPERPGLMLGHSDAPSTQGGIGQCLRRVSRLPFDALISSDLRRCASAARAIGLSRDLAVSTDPRWRELDFGAWDGQPSALLDRAALGRFWQDPDANPPPGGERWSALLARVSAAIADCAAPATLVVTHGGAMRAALATLCGFDQPQIWAVDLPYGALLSLRVWPGEKPAGQIVGLAA